MADRSWRDAIVEVLRSSGEAMHYSDIAEVIAEKRLRSEYGATPAASVNSIICSSIQNEVASPFVRVERGRYQLRYQNPTKLDRAEPETMTEAGLINAFGMYWSRGNVLWSSAPAILGKQQPGSIPVDFSDQRGVYLLHDGRAVVYVGRALDQPLGLRLKQHIGDRLNGRWDRFSWFGVYRVSEIGSLDKASINDDFSTMLLIVTMEAILIEGLEPPQNRKRGDDFRAVEFLQVEDPAIQKTRIISVIEELKKQL
jgi:hypothetical protein